jgi:hypothetical protein
VVAAVVVAVLGLAAGGVWAYLSFFATGSATVYSKPIADITNKPQRTWNWTPKAASSEQPYVSVSAGVEVAGGRSLVLGTSFDYSTWVTDGGYSSAWFQGYDEQYDAGYTAGVAYEQAVNSYYNDSWNNVWPDESTYLPAGVTTSDLTLDNYRGYSDGFNDGTSGTSGASKLKAPPTVEFAPAVVGVSTADGTELWSHPLSGDGKVDLATAMPPTVFGVAGGSEVGYYVDVHAADTGTTTGTIVLLSATDGSKVGSATVADTVFDIVAFGGTVFVSHGTGNDDTVVTALKADDLGGSPLWEKPVKQSSLCEFAPGVLAVAGYGQALTGANGPTCAVTGADHFFATADGSALSKLDTGADVGYEPVGSSFLMLTGTIGSDNGWVTNGSAMLVDADGKNQWKQSVHFNDTGTVLVVDGVILSGNLSGDLGSTSTWVRLDAKTGKKAWSDSSVVGSPIAAQGGLLVIQDGSRLVWFDAGKGTERFSDHVASADQWWYLAGQGDKYLYLASAGELRAYSPQDKGSVWSYTLPTAADSVVRYGSHLYVGGHSLVQIG